MTDALFDLQKKRRELEEFNARKEQRKQVRYLHLLAAITMAVNASFRDASSS